MGAKNLQNSESYKILTAKAQASLKRLAALVDKDGRVSLEDVLGEYAQISKQKPKKAPEEVARKRGQYVRLTDAEYDRLIEDYGEAGTNRMIAYIDGRARETGNRCGWRDWNAVIRRGLREGWGHQQATRRQGQSQKPVSRAMRPPQRTYTAEDLKHIGVNLMED